MDRRISRSALPVLDTVTAVPAEECRARFCNRTKSRNELGSTDLSKQSTSGILGSWKIE